jgi:anti-anti-sigma factor
MKIKETLEQDASGRPVAVLTIKGTLMDGPSVRPLVNYVNRLMLDGIRDVVVDLGEVKWFGASMLGVLSSVLNALRARGGDLRLARVSRKIESLLMVTQVTRAFRSYGTVAEAIESGSEVALVYGVAPAVPTWNAHLPQYVIEDVEMALA